MSILTLYAHPLSSYCQKVLIALYENSTPFEFRHLGPEHPDAEAEFTALWPLRRMPVLVDGDRTVLESSIILEHLDLHHPGPVRLLPDDRRAALDVRFMDRFFDCYVMTPMQRIVGDRLRPQDRRDPYGVEHARGLLDSAYRWANHALGDGREWAAGRLFSMADCAAAPALLYADWSHPIGAEFGALRGYLKRLRARPSFARAVDEARPYRSMFPLGAPEDD